MVRFEVRSSSSGEVYQLEAQRLGDGVRFTCNCAAGEIGQACKHRLALLDGDVTGVHGDTSGLESLQEWVRGSKVERRLKEVAALKTEIESLKKRLRMANAALGRELLEGG